MLRATEVASFRLNFENGNRSFGIFTANGQYYRHKAKERV